MKNRNAYLLFYEKIDDSNCESFNNINAINSLNKQDNENADDNENSNLVNEINNNYNNINGEEEDNIINKCRICFEIYSSEDNPKICLCSCKDCIHLACLKYYIKTKILLIFFFCLIMFLLLLWIYNNFINH